MAKSVNALKKVEVRKRKGIKLSTMNKHKRRSYKKYRGQGRP